MALSKPSAVLLMVDVQEKLAPAMFGFEQMVVNQLRLIRGCRLLQLPIVWTEQLPDKLGPTLSELSVELLASSQPLVKSTFSCWGAGEFCSALAKLKRTDIIIAGIESHVCVYQTARDLQRSGYHVHAATDAMSSRTPENRDIGWRLMQACGVSLSSVEAILFELLQSAEASEFKAILSLIK